MIRLWYVNIPDLLTKKYLEWQLQGTQRKTLDDFAEYLNVKRPTLSAWMNGSRIPGEEHKNRLIELFGTDAMLAFGEDPDLYSVKQNWEHLPPEVRKSYREQIEKKALENESKRTSPSRRTRTVE